MLLSFGGLVCSFFSSSSSSFLSNLIGVGNAGKNKYEVKSMVGKLGR